jgi:hypothetical protein
MSARLEYRTAIRATLFLALTSLSSGAFAFEPDDHQEITAVGLGMASRPFGLDPNRTYMFSSPAVIQIARWNTAVDTATLGGELPKTAVQHCDNNLLAKCAERIRKGVQYIIDRLSAVDHADTEQLEREADEQRQYFGQLLHTLQDFYAHSTWVDNFPNELTLARLDGSDPFRLDAAACRNGDDIRDKEQVVSEMFSTSDFGNVNFATKGFCIHGPCHYVIGGESQQPCSPFTVRIQGIAKDKSSHPFHIRAMDRAEFATALLTRQIIDTLDAKRKYRSLCAFTEQPITDCISYVDPPLSDVLFSGFSPDPGNRQAFNLNAPPQTLHLQLFDRNLGRLLFVDKSYTFTISGSGSCTPTVVPNSTTALAVGCGFGASSLTFETSPYLTCESPANANTVSCRASLQDVPDKKTFSELTSFAVTADVQTTLSSEAIIASNADLFVAPQSGGLTEREIELTLETRVLFSQAVLDKQGWFVFPNAVQSTFNGKVTVHPQVRYYYEPQPPAAKGASP